MKEDLNQFHYLSQLMEKRTETYLFTLGEVEFLLEVLHARIKKYLEIVNPIDETLNLYFKLANSTELALESNTDSVSIDLTGSEAFILMLCVFEDTSDFKMKDKVYHNLHYGVLQTVINDIEDEDN